MKDHLVTTLPKVTKEYVVRFELWIDTIDNAGYSSIIHFTTGNKEGSYGTRTPGVWVKNKNKELSFFSAVNNITLYGHHFFTPFITGRWMRVEISQLKVDSKYWYSLSIDGVQLLKVINWYPAEFRNVKVYASDRWYRAAKGSIRNLSYKSKGSG